MTAVANTTGSIPGFHEGRIEVLVRLLDRFVEQGMLVGGVLGVVDRAGATLLHAFGVGGTVDQPEPIRVDHRFLITSITKQFTGTQVLQLVEAGEIDLEAPVAVYIPEFANNGKDRVTTRQLLTHTSGMDQTSNTTEAYESTLTAADHLQNAFDAELSWQPGEWFEYNSPGFWVLAELVTRLSGMHYTDELREAILDPLRMEDTRYETQPSMPDRFVPVQGHRGGLPEQVRRLAYPAGGIVSTAADLLRFGCCFLNQGTLDGARILGPATVAALWRPYVETTYQERRTSWGLGWQLGGPGDLRSERSLFQSGGSGTAMWVDPDHGLSVVLLTAKSSQYGLSWRIYSQIVNAVLGCLSVGDRA